MTCFYFRDYNRFMRLQRPILPILFFAALVMLIFDPTRTWLMLSTAFGLTWLLAWLWARSLTRGIKIRREVRYGWAQVGDSLEERFTISNEGFFPATWLEVQDHSTLPDYQPGRATNVGANSENNWQMQAQCTRRGLYMLGGTTVLSGDPLGIYTVRVEDEARATLMVMPPVVPLPEITITPGGYSGEGQPRPRAPEQTVGAGGVREYQPGDSLKLVHWPTTARMDKPFVRIFDGAPAGDWWILLDLHAESQLGQGWDSTVEHGIILAASLADQGLRDNQAVGLVSSGEPFLWLPPRPDQAHRWHMLRELALIQPGKLPLDATLERIRPALTRHASLVIITPTASADWLPSLLPLAGRGITPTVLLLERGSFSGNAAETSALEAALQAMNVSTHPIPRDLLDQPAARPGHGGEWNFRVTPHGRAIPQPVSGDASWRELGCFFSPPPPPAPNFKNRK